MNRKLRLVTVSTVACLLMTPLIYGRGFGGGAGGARGGGGGGGMGGAGARGGGGGGGGFGGGGADRGGGGSPFGGGSGSPFGGGCGSARGPGGGGPGGSGFGGAGGAGERGPGGAGPGGGAFGERGAGGPGAGEAGHGGRGPGAAGPGGGGDAYGARGYGGAGAGAGAYGGRGFGSAGAGGGAYGARGYGAEGARFGAEGTAVARFPTDSGLSRYSAFGAAGATHETHLWSNNDIATHGNYVRANFNNYHAFRPDWNTAHPGAWYAAGWAGGTAWHAATWGALAPWCGVTAAPVYYDYGNTVVYQGNDVYVNGTDSGPADAYAQQAITLAGQGSQAQPPTQAQWQALGVFALVQGDEKSSNNVFQLAVNQSGVIRGNYYDAVTDQTTPVAGSVDPQSQRAAWTIGDSQDRVFETGIYNLTKDQTPVLVHTGKDSTQQLLLVRLQQQDGQQSPPGP